MKFHQFAHINLYGMVAPKRAKSWCTVDGITKEGARAPGSCAHVKYPKSPSLLYGISPTAVGAVAKDRAAQALDSAGRKLRCDGRVLAAIVLSYPVPRVMVEQDTGEASTYSEWRDKSTNWLRMTFGSYLLSVVEHVDEGFFHLHAYLVPNLLPNRQLDWTLFHPGRKAAAAATAAGATGKEKHAAYRDGMRAWQDCFHKAVSTEFGHDRLGPRRKRVIRMDHMADKAIAEKKAAAEVELKLQREALARDRSQIANDARREAQEYYRSRWHVLRNANVVLNEDKAALVVANDGLTRSLAAEAKGRQAAEAEAALLRERLAELEGDTSLRFAA